MPPAVPVSSMRRDLGSAYLAAGAKVGSWVVVSALVFRLLGPEAFAMLALIRATIGILNYTSVGLSPAMISLVAAARREGRTGPLAVADPLPGLYSNALVLTGVSAALGLLVIVLYALAFPRLLNVPDTPQLRSQVLPVVIGMGLGILFRLMDNGAGAAIQTTGRIWLDNCLTAATDIAWVILGAAGLCFDRQLSTVSAAYAGSGLLFAVIRWLVAGRLTGVLWPLWGAVRTGILANLLGFGALVLLSQLADYLYAPADYILINKLIGADLVAAYAPAMQIDAGLLLLVSAIGSVLLPRSALAHAAGATGTLRTYYVRGTVASLVILAAGAVAVCVVSPWVFRLWLGHPMPETQAILPLILIHTVIGGSSGTARSILLTMGKAKPFAISAILAGVANIVIGFVLVKYLGLGLNGIIYGTIAAVALRCGVWMPWYVIRSLGQIGQVPSEIVAEPSQDVIA